MNVQVVEIARSWIGTPYVHQASVKGGGADCLGLLRGVWCEVFGSEPEPVPAYTNDWSEPQQREQLWEAAARHLCEKPGRDLTAGNIVLFRMRSGSVAKHLGVIGQGDPCASFIHSYSGHGVVESQLSKPWRRRIAAVFEFPVRSN